MRKRHSDRILLGIVAILVLSGFFILASAFLGPAAKKVEIFYDAFLKQILIGLIGGGALFFIASRIPYHFWRKISIPLFLISFVLTALVFDPRLGVAYGGARRWLDIGFLFFQPSEILKFGFLVYLSSWMAARKENLSSFKYGLIPFLIITALVAGLLFKEPNISALMIIGIIAIALFFIAGGRFKQIAIVILIGASLVFWAAQTKDHVKKRLNVFFNPGYDPQGQSYQLNQSLIAFGSGGIFGRGFGMSVQKFNYLPEPTGDSIFAVVGEEFGFIGASFLVFLFLLFMFRGFLIAIRSPDNFGRLLGSGIVILIITQAFMNMAAMLGVFPLTGLPLPFISKGGSALVMFLLESGVLLNISRYRK